MEVFKKHLDNLPKIGLDYVKENLEEGDVIYEIIGYSRDFGRFDVIKIAQVEPGVFRFFRDDETNHTDKYPRDFNQIFHYLEDGYKAQQVANALVDPFSVKDEDKRKLVIQKGEKIIRYKLVKKDGREFEIST